MSDLHLSLRDSWVQERIDQVLGELSARGLKLRPHFWLSDEWASPDGVPGVAIPFFLAHPRLMALERSQMHEVEGGTKGECIKLLRHEVGHAFQHGFRLQRRKAWREIFGSSARPYPEYYRPNPRSKNFVLHLRGWYAQSHPAEDFAETFAVWLRPNSSWRRRYAGWPARRKLEYVDSLMKELQGRAPVVKRRIKPYSIGTLHKTLGEYYAEKREQYPVTYTQAYDRDLLELFSAEPRCRARETASSFMRRNRRTLIETVVRWARDLGPVVEHVLDEMIGRCRELGLRLKGREPQIRRDLGLILVKHAVDYSRRADHWWPV